LTSGSFTRPANSGGIDNRVGAIAFGGKPRLARVELDQPFADDRQIGPRHGFVEANEDIASFDVIAVARK
jgi:hypothetical protein